MAAVEDDEYEVPLRDQRYFGAGMSRRLVRFVPSTSNEVVVQSLPATPSESAADRYLSIVFNKPALAERSSSAPPLDGEVAEASTTDNAEPKDAQDDEPNRTCDICGRLVTSADTAVAHESNIAHQICLKHSHPPSHLDRRRQGLAVLESQGWDPDSRRGLGVKGQGILHPIKAKENPEKAGIGMKLDDLKRKAVEKPVRLDAGKVRLLEKDGKRRAAKLRDAFYRSEEMEKYLGAEGEKNANLDMAAFKRARRR
jgi:hypothetical protein